MSTQNYVDLIKAAWIFIVLITAHPQFASIQSELHTEAQVLGEVSSIIGFFFVSFFPFSKKNDCDS